MNQTKNKDFDTKLYQHRLCSVCGAAGGILFMTSQQKASLAWVAWTITTSLICVTGAVLYLLRQYS